MKWLLVILLLSGCTVVHTPILGQIVTYRIVCESPLVCEYEALNQCPKGFSIGSYENNIMVFWCVSYYDRHCQSPAQ